MKKSQENRKKKNNSKDEFYSAKIFSKQYYIIQMIFYTLKTYSKSNKIEMTLLRNYHKLSFIS